MVEMSLAERTAIHRALADPHRLEIVDELAMSDRSPSELGASLGIGSNLLAHHLRVLEEAGGVERLAPAGEAPPGGLPPGPPPVSVIARPPAAPGGRPRPFVWH